MGDKTNPPRGVFIVIDGIDGSGKSTQALILAEWLIKNNKDLLMIHEPNSKTTFGKRLKTMLRTKKASKTSKKSWVSVFTQMRLLNLKEIKKALESGKVVICDRYYYSTMAYQLPEKEWKGYSKKFLHPDLAIILDLPIGEALKRINKKNSEQRIKPAFFEKSVLLRDVRAQFLKMPKYFKEVRVINSSSKPHKISSQIKNEVSRVL